MPTEEHARTEELAHEGKLIREYHEQALSQASLQFNVSVVAASTGFLLIGVVSAVAALRGMHSAAIVGVVSGSIMEAVAALFLCQAGKTRERATALYDRLRSDRSRGDAVAVAESINDDRLRDGVKSRLALRFVGLTDPSPMAES